MERAVLKIGGSIITDRNKDEPTPLKEEMARTAKELSSYSGDLVLVHGAGSYGHPQTAASDLHNGVNTDTDRMDFAHIQRLQNELNALYTKTLQDQGIPAIPVQPSACCVMKHGKLEMMDPTIVSGLLEQGMVPVLYGVPAYDTENDVSVLSGDVIAPYVAKLLGADMVLHATDIDGVYEDYPPADDADPMHELTNIPDIFGDSGKTSVTGGMQNKVKQLFAYEQRGRIFSGKEVGRIADALAGKPVGTQVVPKLTA